MMQIKEWIGAHKYAVASTAAALLVLLWMVTALLAPVYSINEDTYIYIDADDTHDSVYTKVNQVAKPHLRGGIRLLSVLTGYHPRTGRYKVSSHDNALALYRRLRSGRQEALRLTIPSVRTTHRLAGALGRRLMLDSLQLAQAFTDSAFCATCGKDTATLICLFIPNTYEVYWDTTLPELMQRMSRECAAFWNDRRTAQATAAGLTPDQVYTLASIVDEETAYNPEKPDVAGMYLNRLRCGMPLQADPTIKFALGDFGLRRIRHGHLTVESPYNTYMNTGLPPGPIRVASVAGINAVLNHTEHHYLYMCAKEDFSGRHNFARTYSEHLANAARYSKALDKRHIQ